MKGLECSNLGKHLASFATNAILAFVVSVVMTLVRDCHGVGMVSSTRNRLCLALLVIILLATWTMVRSCGLKFSHFAFLGFLAMWAVPLLMRPSIPGGFAQATGLVLELIPSIPTQAFLRALLVLILQTLVLLAMDRRKFRDDWRQLIAWWTRNPSEAVEGAGNGSGEAVSPSENGHEKN